MEYVNSVKGWWFSIEKKNLFRSRSRTLVRTKKKLKISKYSFYTIILYYYNKHLCLKIVQSSELIYVRHCTRVSMIGESLCMHS